jgi:hypothetical protein
MFLELVAAFAGAIGAAGLVMLANRVTGGRLPRWSAPVVAAITMIAFAVWSEYSWADRTRAKLPEGTTVFRTFEHTAFWKPWTYAWPQTSALAVVDTATARSRPDAPHVLLADVYLFARWRAPDRTPQLVDCTAAARAPVTDAALADPRAARWRSLGADAPLIETLCPPNGRGE